MVAEEAVEDDSSQIEYVKKPRGKSRGFLGLITQKAKAPQPDEPIDERRALRNQ